MVFPKKSVCFFLRFKIDYRLRRVLPEHSDSKDEVEYDLVAAAAAALPRGIIARGGGAPVRGLPPLLALAPPLDTGEEEEGVETALKWGWPLLA